MNVFGDGIIQRRSSPTTYASGIKSGIPSYIIFKSGSTIKAENGRTGSIESTGSDISTVANTIGESLSSGGLIHIAPDTYTISSKLLLYSNIIYQADLSTTLKAIDGYSVNSNMIENADTTNGNTNITFRDIKLDGNQENRSGSLNESFGSNAYFKNLSYSTINNINSTNGFVSNLTLGPGSNNNRVIGNQYTNSHWHNLLILGDDSPITYTYNNIVAYNVVDTSGVNNGLNEGAGIEVAKYAIRNVFIGNSSTNSKEGGLHLFYFCNNNVVIGNSFYNNRGAGVYIVDASDYNVISGNTIFGSGTTGISGATAFVSRTGYYNIITNNLISDCNYNGIRGALIGSTIEGNIIANCGITGTSTLQHGVYLNSVNDVRFVNNRITGSYSRGATIEDISNSIISNNYFASNVSQGMLIDSTNGVNDNTITDNVFKSNGSSGLVMFDGTIRCNISNNVSRSNTGNGIDIRGGTDCVISNNNSSGNSSYGLVLQNDASSVGTTGCSITGNRITGNTSGGISETGAADYNIYTGNNLRGNTTANFAYVGTNNEIGHNITAD